MAEISRAVWVAQRQPHVKTVKLRLRQSIAAHGREHFVQVVPFVMDELVLGADRFTRGLQHAVKSAQDGEGLDDLAVLVFLVRSPQKLGILPNQVGKFGHFVLFFSDIPDARPDSTVFNGVITGVDGSES